MADRGHAATVGFDNGFADVQAQPRARDTAVVVAGAEKFIKDLHHIFGFKPLTLILNADFQPIPPGLGADHHRRFRLAVFEGVTQQILYHLGQAIRIDLNLGAGLGEIYPHALAFGGLEADQDMRDQLLGVTCPRQDRNAAAIVNPADIQKLIHQPRQKLGPFMNDFDIIGRTSRRNFPLQQLTEPQNCG